MNVAFYVKKLNKSIHLVLNFIEVQGKIKLRNPKKDTHMYERAEVEAYAKKTPILNNYDMAKAGFCKQKYERLNHYQYLHEIKRTTKKAR